MSSERHHKPDRAPVMAYRSPAMKAERTPVQAVALYIAVFCATALGMALLVLAAAYLLGTRHY